MQGVRKHSEHSLNDKNIMINTLNISFQIRKHCQFVISFFNEILTFWNMLQSKIVTDNQWKIISETNQIKWISDICHIL